MTDRIFHTLSAAAILALATVVPSSAQEADPAKIEALRRQGLSNAQIARRLGVTEAAVGYALKKAKAACTPGNRGR